MMEIPYTKLSEESLRAIIEEYITREGTEYGVKEYSFEQKIEQIRQQLLQGEIKINFDTETETCNLFAIK
ncbi:MAG: YheU family protein [Pseudomonadales bacterium]|nr:YheU family protein [Pseudomonadales bacterium]